MCYNLMRSTDEPAIPSEKVDDSGFGDCGSSGGMLNYHKGENAP